MGKGKLEGTRWWRAFCTIWRCLNLCHTNQDAWNVSCMNLLCVSVRRISDLSVWNITVATAWKRAWKDEKSKPSRPARREPERMIHPGDHERMKAWTVYLGVAVGSEGVCSEWQPYATNCCRFCKWTRQTSLPLWSCSWGGCGDSRSSVKQLRVLQWVTRWQWLDGNLFGGGRVSVYQVQNVFYPVCSWKYRSRVKEWGFSSFQRAVYIWSQS